MEQLNRLTDISVQILVAPPSETALQSFKTYSRSKAVHPHDRIQIRLSTPVPCFFYSCWVTPLGDIQSLYPWEPGRWRLDSDLLSKIKPIMKLTLPSDNSSWSFEKNKGIETLVAFACSKPLSASALSQVSKELNDLRLPSITELSLNGPFIANLLDKSASSDPSASFTLTNLNTALESISYRHLLIQETLQKYLDAGKCFSLRNSGIPRT